MTGLKSQESELMLRRRKTSKYSKMHFFVKGEREREIIDNCIVENHLSYQFWYFRLSFILGRLDGICFFPDRTLDCLLCYFIGSLNRHSVMEWRLG